MTPEDNIPKEFQAQSLDVEDPQVPTELTISRTYDANQINSLQNLGLIKVDGLRFQSISQLGDAVKGLGLLRLQHGAYMISMENVLQCMGWAGRVVAGEPFEDGRTPTPKEKMEAAQLVGYLGGQLARVNGAVTRSEQARAEVAVQLDRQRRQSFAPGMTIPVEAVKTPS